MNKKIYRKVHLLAVEMLKADEASDSIKFHTLYEELKKLCIDNEQNAALNHPVQWETLADFTEDNEQSLALYQQALDLAETLKAKDYIASVNYSMAQVLLSIGERDQARAAAQKAKETASGGADKELRHDIQTLLDDLGSTP